MLPDALMLAFWMFANAGMLFWGAAAAIPILLHLWSRRKYRELEWGAMDFLLAALRQHARRLRLEQWLLLAIRSLILVALAAALANPVASISGGGATVWGLPQRTHHILIVDGSYSMGTLVGEETRFALAVAEAQAVVSSAHEGDGFSLLLMTDRPQVVIREPLPSAAQVAEELSRLEYHHGGGNLLATLQHLGPLLSDATPARRFERREIHFFSDLGLTTWEVVRQRECRQLFRLLAARARLVWHPVDEADERTNLAVTRLTRRPSPPLLQRDLTLDVELERFGPPPASRTRLDLLVDEEVVQTAMVDLTAFGRATTTFLHRFALPGEHVVEVRLSADALPLDNQRFAVIPVRDTIRLLAVEGTPRAARQLALALAPGSPERAAIRVERIPDNALVETELHDYDLVLLCNVPRFGPDEAHLLRQYLRGGGRIACFLGDAVDRDNYNRELGGDAENRILPARLETPRSERLYLFQPLAYEHPIVDSFRGQERAGLLTAPTWKYVPLQAYDPQRAKMALAFDSGDPAIVEESLGRGHSLLFATAVSTESLDQGANPPRPWSGLAAWPAFPPLMHELVGFLLRSGDEQRNVLVGESLQGAAADDSAGSVTVTDPRGQEIQLGVQRDQLPGRWTLPETEWRGLYRVSGAGPPGRDQRFAANLQTAESDPARLDPDDLPSQLQRALDAQQIPAGTSSGLGDWPLFRSLLGVVLGLLVLESLLRFRMSRSTGAG